MPNIGRISQDHVVSCFWRLSSEIALRHLQALPLPDRPGRVGERHVQFDAPCGFYSFAWKRLQKSSEERARANRRVQKGEIALAVLELVPSVAGHIERQGRRRGELPPLLRSFAVLSRSSFCCSTSRKDSASSTAVMPQIPSCSKSLIRCSQTQSMPSCASYPKISGVKIAAKKHDIANVVPVSRLQLADLLRFLFPPLVGVGEVARRFRLNHDRQTIVPQDMWLDHHVHRDVDLVSPWPVRTEWWNANVPGVIVASGVA